MRHGKAGTQVRARVTVEFDVEVLKEAAKIKAARAKSLPSGDR
jgi:hypothetical protein